MVKVEMYKAFDGKIFENREECMAYEKENGLEEKYKKLKEIRQKLNEYCEICNDCKECVFEKNCTDIYKVLNRR